MFKTFLVEIVTTLIIMHQPIPVSYTHLDVYKRQSMFHKEMEVLYGDGKKKPCSRQGLILIVLPSKHEEKSFSEKCLSVYPVSYTHLDVYKRQGIH